MPNAPVLDFANLSTQAIAELLKHHQLNLTPDEALTIQHTLLKRPPTLAECVLWSIQGSEHCSYKSSRPYLSQFMTQGPHVILGPKEDAGIVAVATDHAGKRYGVVMSHESHNHPSQIVPYEGAATGVGGNIRDVSCMGAEVIALADGLRFGDLARAKTHWLHQEVVNGIAGYGNPMGIPNLAGDLYYDPGYNENCLVTVVTLGIVREDHIIHSYAPKGAEQHVFILVGKATDNSGFGGASFASSQLNEDQTERNKGAVQEPNAFLERHLVKANQALFVKLRERGLLNQVGFKDLGAGGIACASVELAEAGGYGADIDLDAVSVTMTDLAPHVILCAETQERFMWVVPPELVDEILAHYNLHFDLPAMSEGACARVIGKIRTDGNYIVRAQGQILVQAQASDITKGIVYNRPFVINEKVLQEPELEAPKDYHAELLALLAHENIASRAPVYEKYDKQVQGRTFLERGLASAGVMQPFNEDAYPEEIRTTGIAISLDQHPRYTKIDAYWGAVNAVTRAVRRVVATGAAPVAITDCLCFGNPEDETALGDFVAAVRGIVDACAAVKLQAYPDASLPVIAGNVSFYNESAQGAIPPSPMISCLGMMKEVMRAVTFSLKRQQSLIVMIGERFDECGGSSYYQLHGELGANLPKPNLSHFNAEIHAVLSAVQQGLVLSAQTIEDGGLAVALAKMCFKNAIGVKVNVPGDLTVEKKLFSESGGFLLEVGHEHIQVLQDLFQKHNVTVTVIGKTNSDSTLEINSVINLSIFEAKEAYEQGLRARLTACL